MTERTSRSPELDEETPTFRLQLVLIVFILLAIIHEDNNIYVYSKYCLKC